MTTAQDLQAALNNVAQSLADLAEQIGKQVPAAPAAEDPKPAATVSATKPAVKKVAAKKAAPTKKPVKRARKPVKIYDEVDANTPKEIREERQRLILKEIDAAGGFVSREEWLTITDRYGYNSRRLGGFFAKNGGAGMVEMTPDRKLVHITSHGRARL